MKGETRDYWSVVCCRRLWPVRLCAVCVGVCAETLADAVVETVYRKVERWPVADALDEKEEEL